MNVMNALKGLFSKRSGTQPYIFENVTARDFLKALRNVNHGLFIPHLWNGDYIVRINEHEYFYAVKRKNNTFGIFKPSPDTEMELFQWVLTSIPKYENQTVIVYHCDKFKRYDPNKGTGRRGMYAIINTLGRGFTNVKSKKRGNSEIFSFNPSKYLSVYFYTDDDFLGCD